MDDFMISSIMIANLQQELNAVKQQVNQREIRDNVNHTRSRYNFVGASSGAMVHRRNNKKNKHKNRTFVRTESFPASSKNKPISSYANHPYAGTYRESNPLQEFKQSCELEEELSMEQKLLLSLFMLNSSQHAAYIEKRGKELGVLAVDSNYRIVVNQRVQQHAERLMAEANAYINQTDIRPSPNETAFEQQQHGPKEEAQTVVQGNADNMECVLISSPNGTDLEQQQHGLKEEAQTVVPCNADNMECFLISSPSETSHDQQQQTLTEKAQTVVQDDAGGVECVLISSSRETACELQHHGTGEDEAEAHTTLQDNLESVMDQLVENNVGYLVEAPLRVDVHNSTQATVYDARRRANVLIGSIMLRQCAMDSDVVRLFVLESEINPTTSTPSAIDKSMRSQNRVGFVIKILEKRHNRQCVGTILPTTDQEDLNYRTFLPRDARIPPVRIFKQYLHEALNEKESYKSTEETDGFYLAQINEWQGEIPIGKILKSMDKTELLKFENESILLQYNRYIAPYPEDILTRVPSEPYNYLEEIGRREDLRGQCVLTIGSATARHLEDALSCAVLQNGNFEVGVHIADVTYFLREQSELDELAKVRASTISMVDTVYDMLPEQLCSTCSLLPGKDKLAFSVFWEILPDGTVLNSRFARSVINSCAKLSYEQAQMLLDNLNGENAGENLVPEIFNGHTVQSLGIVVEQLQSIAVKLREQRTEDGYLEIDQSGYTFWFDTAVYFPIEYKEHKLRKTFHLFIELANTSVAQGMYAAITSTPLIRYSKPPSAKMIEQFVQSLSKHGYTFSFASTKAIRESMDAIIAGAEHPDAAKIVLHKLLTNFKHFASPNLMYTNFTSPIRRYTDCMAHRVLAAVLEIGEELKRTPDELLELVVLCNKKTKLALQASEASLMLCYRQWLGTVKQHETVGAVMGYDAKCIELILIGTGIVLEVLSEELSFATVLFNPSEPINSIRWIPKDSSIQPITLKIFSKVRVTIKLVNDAITVCSILPMAAELPVVPDSNPEASV